MLVRHLPRESATVRALMGEAADWGPVEHMLAALIDIERIALWQRAGNKRTPRPQPIDRPGASKPGRKRYGGRRRVVTVEQMDELAARWAPTRDDGGDVDGDRAGLGVRVDPPVDEGLPRGDRPGDEV